MPSKHNQGIKTQKSCCYIVYPVNGWLFLGIHAASREYGCSPLLQFLFPSFPSPKEAWPNHPPENIWSIFIHTHTHLIYDKGHDGVQNPLSIHHLLPCTCLPLFSFNIGRPWLGKIVCVERDPLDPCILFAVKILYDWRNSVLKLMKLP